MMSGLADKSTVAERVADILRDQIRDGHLAAGTHLRQNELAATLGVSSTPVRSAFGILEREGLLEHTNHRGVTVFRPTIADLLEAFEIRIALETLACRRAASGQGAREVERLRALVSRMRDRRTSDAEFLQSDLEFHRRIADAAERPRLRALIATQRSATQAYMSFLGVDARSGAEAADEHDLIVDAIELGDVERAAQAMADHLEARGEALRRRLESSV